MVARHPRIIASARVSPRILTITDYDGFHYVCAHTPPLYTGIWRYEGCDVRVSTLALIYLSHMVGVLYKSLGLPARFMTAVEAPTAPAKCYDERYT